MEVLVTVGTTKFSALIDEFCTSEVIQALKHQGCTRVYMQYGKSDNMEKISAFRNSGIELETFAYCDTLEPYYEKVHLVIGHAGAGTIIESLRHGLKMIAVVNDTLMDNHQTEIAETLAGYSYLIKASPKTLVDAIKESQTYPFVSYPKPDAKKFSRFIDGLMLL